MLLCVITTCEKPLSQSSLLLCITMAEKQTLKEIDHTPPTGDSVSNVWERGTEQAE